MTVSVIKSWFTSVSGLHDLLSVQGYHTCFTYPLITYYIFNVPPNVNEYSVSHWLLSDLR